METGTRIAAGARRALISLSGLAGALGASAAGGSLWIQAAAGAGALFLCWLMLGPADNDAPVALPGAERAPDRALLKPRLGVAALERLPLPLLLIDSVGAIVYANPAARALFERLRPGEHYSMSFRAPDFLDALAEALAGGPPRSFEFSLHGDRNRVIQAHVDGGVLGWGRGDAPRGALCLFQDRTHDLRLARMRTDFIANASHELRTPLSSIRGFIETLLGPARDDPEARDRFLGIMQSQSQRMQRLIDDLLSLNRIELNEHVNPTALLDLGELAHETAEAMGPMARDRDARIEVRAPAHGPLVRGDRDQLIQAFGNLLENGLKYGARGGVVEVLAADPSPDHPGMTGLTVRDHGEGIAREHIPRLTERFYRVSAKRSRDQGGTGLGLAIVKHILSRHRGELSIESELGEGSRFTLWLPEAQPEPSSDAEAGTREGLHPDARPNPTAEPPRPDRRAETALSSSSSLAASGPAISDAAAEATTAAAEPDRPRGGA